MENLSNNGIHHIDGTYRITVHGFPFLVYGVSDQVGRFHPVCFMITSHETIPDFFVFYESLIKLTESFEIEYDPEFIMQDACLASETSVLRFFPEVKILMCYFHVMKNVCICIYIYIIPRMTFFEVIRRRIFFFFNFKKLN